MSYKRRYTWYSKYSRIEGLPECLAAFEKLGGTFDGLGLGLELLDCAGYMRSNIQMLAPSGKTGNLKNGIVARMFDRAPSDAPAAFVAIDYNIAPHGHLVEFGTTERYLKGTAKEWNLRAKRTGSEGAGKPGYRGHMPAHPFFRPGVDMSRSVIMMRLKSYMQEQIKRRVAYIKQYSQGTAQRLAEL